ncbi:ABC transporter ATP-binding protein [Erwinia sp. JUb26]|uniref:ABC transporter ATP-binding protein n=1 Tax=Erwinia sp. JUb26 TaxID=2485126 RepID=UPI000F4741AA|nr:ABC transporter ATP-binding protein [Erwinia sp. JUb26]ROR08911.1 amino acid/amide ABC transporter ATP-binding protein 1 (HAAT family) [Erwinia sp. JUb26]
MSLSEASPASLAALRHAWIAERSAEAVKPGASLQLSGIALSFGGVKALSDVSLVAEPSSLLAIIGPNGAGKSTLLNVISGLYRPDRGEIALDDRRYRALRPQHLARAGVARTFQNLALFSGLSVTDNVLQGLAYSRKTSLLGEIFGLPRARHETAGQLQQARAVINFFGLDAVASSLTSSLSYGMQKRVELARALVARPRLLLLDEPMAGMTLADKQQLSDLIREIRRHFGTTILLIEHDIAVVMSLSDRVVVLEYGRNIATGTPNEIRRNPAVIAAYLGSSADTAAPEARG